MRRILLSLLALIMGASIVALVPGASDAASTCRVRWGSVSKELDETSTGDIVGVRTGRHQCFDRLVIDLDGSVPGYRVQYTTAFTQDGSGHVIPVSGGAILAITLVAPAHDDDYNPTLERSAVEAIDLGGYRTFRDLVYDATFEGLTGFGLGVRARLPFRVFTVDGPGEGSRLVIDVAHRW